MRRGFTIVEMLIAACLLVIMLGLAVSMSRQVRAQSARLLTADLLARLDRQTQAYVRLTGGVVPQVTALVPAELAVAGELQTANVSATTRPVVAKDIDETPLRRRATANNHELLSAIFITGVTADFRDLSPVVFDPVYLSLRDAWGTPIAFLPRQEGLIGMAPRNGFFFVSAGPDRLFLTRGDNLYSYEAFRVR